MKKTYLAAALLGVLALAPAAQGHELKVLASRLVTKPGDRITIYLSWGHALPVDDLIDAGSVERYEVVLASDNRVPLKRAGLSLQANSFLIEEPGVHQLVAGRKPSVMTYVIDADGKQVLKRGGKGSITVADGRAGSSFRSQQCAKAILINGDPGEATVKPLGLPIEIVPLTPPSIWQAKQPLRCRVLLDGLPLSNTEIQATPVGHRPEGEWNQAVRTDIDGVATIRPESAGTWVLRVQHRTAALGSARQEYDHESYTGTLALEIRP